MFSKTLRSAVLYLSFVFRFFIAFPLCFAIWRIFCFTYFSSFRESFFFFIRCNYIRCSTKFGACIICREGYKGRYMALVIFRPGGGFFNDVDQNLSIDIIGIPSSVFAPRRKCQRYGVHSRRVLLQKYLLTLGSIFLKCGSSVLYFRTRVRLIVVWGNICIMCSIILESDELFIGCFVLFFVLTRAFVVFILWFVGVWFMICQQ